MNVKRFEKEEFETMRKEVDYFMVPSENFTVIIEKNVEKLRTD
jgi:hypothetical protein